MNIKELLISGIIMILIDYIYLNSVANYFNNLLIKIQKNPMKVKLTGAILCYILLVLGLNYFIISKKNKLLDAFILGFIIYGVFETTNYAIFKDWEIFPVLLDTVWGGILFYLTTYATYKIANIN